MDSIVVRNGIPWITRVSKDTPNGEKCIHYDILSIIAYLPPCSGFRINYSTFDSPWLTQAAFDEFTAGIVRRLSSTRYQYTDDILLLYCKYDFVVTLIDNCKIMCKQVSKLNCANDVSSNVSYEIIHTKFYSTYLYTTLLDILQHFGSQVRVTRTDYRGLDTAEWACILSSVLPFDIAKVKEAFVNIVFTLD